MTTHITVSLKTTVIFLAAIGILQIAMGMGMIVQYGRLTGFIDCQADYNESTSDSRDKRIPAQTADQEATAQVLVAVQSGDQTRISRAINRAVRAHENYVKVQRENPYKPPSDFCGGTGKVVD